MTHSNLHQVTFAQRNVRLRTGIVVHGRRRTNVLIDVPGPHTVFDLDPRALREGIVNLVSRGLVVVDAGHGIGNQLPSDQVAGKGKTDGHAHAGAACTHGSRGRYHDGPDRGHGHCEFVSVSGQRVRVTGHTIGHRPFLALGLERHCQIA